MQRLEAFEQDPERRLLEVEVLEVGRDERGEFAVLDDTILYPEGGGQPADRGLLGGLPVLDVQRVEGTIRHYLESAVSRGSVTLELDWDRRYDHMQQHTAQHLLTAVAADSFGWNTTSFHLGSSRCDIELDAAALGAEQFEALEDAAVRVVRSARPVTSRRVTVQEYEGLGEVRSRGLPADHSSDIRVVEIADLDRCACGGTHLRNTAEIETLKLLGTEPMRGGTRLFWVAGQRVRRLLGQHEARATALRGLLDTGTDELVEVAAGKLARLRESDRRVRTLEKELADQVARNLLASDASVVEAHFEGVDAAFLQQIGRRFVKGAGTRVALLTAAAESGQFFVLAAGADYGADLREVGARVATALDGHGGGGSSLYQGKAGSLACRGDAVALLRART